MKKYKKKNNNYYSLNKENTNYIYKVILCLIYTTKTII